MPINHVDIGSIGSCRPYALDTPAEWVGVCSPRFIFELTSASGVLLTCLNAEIQSFIGLAERLERQTIQSEIYEFYGARVTLELLEWLVIVRHTVRQNELVVSSRYQHIVFRRILQDGYSLACSIFPFRKHIISLIQHGDIAV